MERLSLRPHETTLRASASERFTIVEEMIEALSLFLSHLSEETSDREEIFSLLFSLLLQLLQRGFFEPEASETLQLLSAKTSKLKVLNRFLRQALHELSPRHFRAMLCRCPSLVQDSSSVVSAESLASLLEEFLREESCSLAMLALLQQLLSQLQSMQSSNPVTSSASSFSSAPNKVQRQSLRLRAAAVSEAMLFGAAHSEISGVFVQYIDLTVHRHLPMFQNSFFLNSGPSARSERVGEEDLDFAVLDKVAVRPIVATSPTSFNEFSVFDQSDVLLMPSSSVPVASRFDPPLIASGSGSSVAAIFSSPSQSSNLFSTTDFASSFKPSDFASTTDPGPNQSDPFSSTAAATAQWSVPPLDSFHWSSASSFPASGFNDFSSDFASKPSEIPPSETHLFPSPAFTAPLSFNGFDPNPSAANPNPFDSFS